MGVPDLVLGGEGEGDRLTTDEDCEVVGSLLWISPSGGFLGGDRVTTSEDCEAVESLL